MLSRVVSVRIAADFGSEAERSLPGVPQKRKVPPPTNEKIPVPALSRLCDGLFGMAAVNCQPNKYGISEHVHCLSLTFLERGYYYGEGSAMATVLEHCSTEQDLKRNGLCLSTS